jgi:nucleoside-diphosphate-sugar epimerase/FMN phosphatase YigB (HAD superfamily)
MSRAPLPRISTEDSAHILTHTADVWPLLRNAHLFITGATGFYGRWLLESLIAANEQLGTNIHATLLSRAPQAFARECPELAAHPLFTWLTGELATAELPAQIDYLIDLATPSAAEIDFAQVSAGDTAITGAVNAKTALIERTLAATARLIAHAQHSGVKRALYASSGAVHGHGSPGYGELKRRSEALWLASPIDTVITRGYSFIGPYLPLTDKFAVGSFLRDALAGGPIRIQGDGTPVRSYLYGADLAIALLRSLMLGQPNIPHDIGSSEAISLRDLAHHIASHCPGISVDIFGAASAPHAVNVYLPTQLSANNIASSPLSSHVPISLDDAIRRTLNSVKRNTAQPKAAIEHPHVSHHHKLPLHAACLAALTASTRLVTLDVFDTLLWRTTLFPRDVFLHLNPHQPRVVAQLRYRAEQLVSTVCRRLLKREPRLADFYLGHQPYAAGEFELEKTLCRANPEGLALVDTLRSRGIAFVAVSDMYLSAQHIQTLLMHCGYGAMTVFSSSDSNLTKSHGALFPHVWRQCSVSPDETLHLGDNPWADVAIPRQQGGQALHVVTPRDLLLSLHTPTNSPQTSFHESVFWGKIARQLYLNRQRLHHPALTEALSKLFARLDLQWRQKNPPSQHDACAQLDDTLKRVHSPHITS